MVAQGRFDNYDLVVNKMVQVEELEGLVGRYIFPRDMSAIYLYIFPRRTHSHTTTPFEVSSVTT